jgi:4-amino-4-deoxy-L-arabinose transferase-like glycosyltransferase
MWFQIVPLWVDEISWGNRILDGLDGTEMRPIGFVLLTRWLVNILGYYEYSLRFLPWLSGVLAMFVAGVLAKGLFRSLGARIFLVAAVALHPAAIDLAREFKPYSIAFCLHLAMATSALCCLQTRKLSWLIGTLVLALLGVFFSQDVVFAFPGIYLAIGIQCLRERRRRDFLVTVSGAILTLAILGAHYWLVWRHLIGKDSGAEEFWGEKYHVFFTGSGLRERFHWWLATYKDQAGMPGLRARDWSILKLRNRSHQLWLWFHSLGLLRLVLARRGNELLLLVLPLVMQSLFNALGYWPLGSFRTCFFVLAYLLPIAAFALDWPAFDRRWSAAPALIVVALPLLLFERSWNRWKAYYCTSAAVPQTAKMLVALQGEDYDQGPEPLIVQRMLWSPWSYYTQNRPGHETLEKRIDSRFTLSRNIHKDHIFREAEDALNLGASRVWVVLDHPNKHRPKVGRNLEIQSDVWVGGHTTRVLLLGLRR